MVAGEYFVPYDKAVKIRAQRYQTYRCRHYYMHQRKLGHFILMLPYKHLEMFYRNGFFKKILRIEPGSHYEWDDTENGVDLSDAPTVVAVPDMSLKILLQCLYHLSL